MLHEFLTRHRVDLIEQCRLKSASRRLPEPSAALIEHGIPLFLGQLIATLRSEALTDTNRPSAGSGPGHGDPAPSTGIRETAALHGIDLWRQGFTIDQVVHCYGDLCQAITESAFVLHEPFAANEFKTLNLCLDDAIADAVSTYSATRDVGVNERGEQSLNERLGVLAHELRNLIHTATLAFGAIKRGNVGTGGATAAIVDRSLLGLSHLIDRTLTDVRMVARSAPQLEVLSVADFVAEACIAASLQAQAAEVRFTVSTTDPSLALRVDRDLLLSAVSNLLQNAFKFTDRHSTVVLHAYASADRIRIDVEDQCGGLAPGLADTMFLPFKQGGTDRSGLGLGLSICRRAIEAHGGTLGVRDRPGIGCVFTIDLPRYTPPDMDQAATHPHSVLAS